MIKAVLFDLDGTLLPLDMDLFIKMYFGGIAKKMSGHGYDPQKLIDAIWRGTFKAIQNDGSATNEAVFWNEFCAVFGEKARADIPLFDDYYRNEFESVKQYCGYNVLAPRAVRALKPVVPIVLATNPIFPRVGMDARIRWAGLDPDDFSLITSYENMSFCKPNPAYFTQIADMLGVRADECVMIGNDVDEDMIPAASVGMRTFLLTDCLINKSGADIASYAHGGFAELDGYLSRLMA